MNDQTTFIGIDNGISGGIAFYKPEARTVEVHPMPTVRTKKLKGFKNEYDITTLLGMIRQYPDIRMAILEKAQPFPGQGVVSMFGIGKGFGLMEGILAALAIPYQIVHPKTWQKKIFEGIPHKDTKQASILTAQKLFPGMTFRATERTTIAHHGITDAVLMAYYGYLLHK